MKTVNLLPQWYLQQRRQTRNLRVHLCAMVIAGACMVGAAFVGRQRISVLLTERDLLQSRLTQISDPDETLKSKQAELRRLDDLRLAYRELGKTIPMSCVIQQLQNDMTAGMALAHVNIEVRPDPVKGSGMVGDTRNPPKYHDVANLTVEGIAPNDVQIAQLIEKLVSNQLFTEVTLDYTRTGTLGAFIVRRFEIKMKMDLDRLTIEDPAGGQVATGAPTHGE